MSLELHRQCVFPALAVVGGVDGVNVPPPARKLGGVIPADTVELHGMDAAQRTDKPLLAVLPMIQLHKVHHAPQDSRPEGIRFALPRFHDVPQSFAVDLFAQLVVQLQRRAHAADAVVAQLHTVVVEGKPRPVSGCDKRLGRRIAAHHLGAQLDARRQGCGVTVLLGKEQGFLLHRQTGVDLAEDWAVLAAVEEDAALDGVLPVHHIVVVTVLMFVLMFAIDYRLGILLILTTVIGVLQYRKMSGGTEFLSGYSAALQKMSAATVEYVRGMQIIKIFGVTVQYYKTLIDSIKEYKQYVYQYSLSCKNPYVGFQVLFNVFYAFAVPAAVVLISYGEPAMLILAKIVFFAVFSGAVFTSFTSIMFTGQDNFGAQNTLNQLDELTASMDQAKLPHGSEENFQNFDIEFRHVDFKYDDTFVLKNFNLTLHQNKTYALIGSSGGGKSTIAKLISGFYPVDGGEILIGGKNIQSYSEKALIQNIAFVFQHSQLLKTSIYENVRIGNSQATRQQIMDALDAANCTSILDKFSQREMTVIGAKGVYLSGGEVQRIAIARAILKNANIIIMDEVSAAADPENEYELQQAFQKLMRGKTVIMIAHRLSSIQNVDQILFVQNGKVVEQGTHNELMAYNGRYKDFQDVYCKANQWRLA